MKRDIPPPPAPPSCRVEYRGADGAFFGPEPEFEKWKAEPWWRRFFGLTAWDRKRKAALSQTATAIDDTSRTDFGSGGSEEREPVGWVEP